MKISGNTVLITGGGTGIGLALAASLSEKDNTVIICGRRKHILLEAHEKLPGMHIKVCDIADRAQREELFSWVTSGFKNINVLINNAGVQKRIDLTKGSDEFDEGENEIITNFEAPVGLCALFVPHLMKQKHAAIINVSSGLGFIPMAVAPVYSATKAALHSYSLSLRHQLKNTSVKVFEVIPPMVDTELDKGAREQRGSSDRGIPASDVAGATLTAIKRDKYEIAIGMAEQLCNGAKTDPEKTFQFLNK